MPRFYLRPIGDETRYSDSGDYPEQPSAREGFEWMAGMPPANATPYKEISLADQLNAQFESLDEDMQAMLAPLKVAVKLELEQGRLNIAKRIIALAQIPEPLESVREAMLSEFEAKRPMTDHKE